MDTKETLLAFLAAETRRDWAEYRQYLSPYVVCIQHAGGTRTVIGIENYIEAAQKRAWGARAVACEALYAGDEGDRVAAIFKNELGKRFCGIFEFENGLIVREHAYVLE